MKTKQFFIWWHSLIRFGLAGCLLFSLSYCAKVFEIDPARPKPSIVSIIPSCGRFGDTITLKGKFFSSVKSENLVNINGLPLTVISANDSLLRVIVPENPGKGFFETRVGDISTRGPSFDYILTGLVSEVFDDIGIGGLAVDKQGILYMADHANNFIMQIDLAGESKVIAGTGLRGFRNGQGNIALFNNPQDVVVDSKGNLFVSDYGNHCIRKITPDGVVSLYAGTLIRGIIPSPGFKDTVRLASAFDSPLGIAIDKDDNLYVCDAGNSRIRKITPDVGNNQGKVTTIAGNGQYGGKDGPALSATFSYPIDLVVDDNYNVFVSDHFEDPKVRKISAQNIVSTIGKPDTIYTDCKNTSVRINFPYGIAVDNQGNVYVAIYISESNYKIITISPENKITTLAGGANNNMMEGTGEKVRIPYAGSVALFNNNLYVSANYRLLKIAIK